LIPQKVTDYVAQGLALFTSQFGAASAPQLRAMTASYLAEANALEAAIWDALTSRRLATAKLYGSLPGTFNVQNGIGECFATQNISAMLGTTITFASQPGTVYQVVFVDLTGMIVTLNPAYTGTTAAATQATTNLTNSVLDVIGNLIGQPRQGLDDLDYLSVIYLRIAVDHSAGRDIDWSNFAAILLRTSDGPAFYFESGTGGTGGSAAFFFGVWDMTLNANVVATVLEDAVSAGVGPNCFAWSTWPDGADFAVGSLYDVPPDGSSDFTAILGVPLAMPGNIEPGALVSGYSALELGWGSVYDGTVGGLMVAASQL